MICHSFPRTIHLREPIVREGKARRSMPVWCLSMHRDRSMWKNFVSNRFEVVRRVEVDVERCCEADRSDERIDASKIEEISLSNKLNVGLKEMKKIGSR